MCINNACIQLKIRDGKKSLSKEVGHRLFHLDAKLKSAPSMHIIAGDWKYYKKKSSVITKWHSEIETSNTTEVQFCKYGKCPESVFFFFFLYFVFTKNLHIQ